MTAAVAGEEQGIRTLMYRDALNEALKEEMRRDLTVFCMGEGIAERGGSYKVTDGLLEEFGGQRVFDTPIAEASFTGAGVGAAITGMRPVVEILFIDFTMLIMDQLVNQAAKYRLMSGGKGHVPLVLRTQGGVGEGVAAQHSQSLHALFAHIPGLKVALPSCPRDAKGLLKTAIRDDNPVLVFEGKMMYNDKGPVPEEEYTIPFGVAEVKRPGDDCTIIAVSSMVGLALEAAQTLSREDEISVEVVDPRTLVPLDEETLVESVRKTGYALIVDEASLRYGVTGELAALVTEAAFDYLDAPVKRIGAANVPIPFSPTLEGAAIPHSETIVDAVRALRGKIRR